MEKELYKATFVRPSPRMPGVLYEPVTKGDKSCVGVLVMHSDNDYLDQPTGPELAKRGYTVLCTNTSDHTQSFPMKISDVKQGVDLLGQGHVLGILRLARRERFGKFPVPSRLQRDIIKCVQLVKGKSRHAAPIGK